MDRDKMVEVITEMGYSELTAGKIADRLVEEEKQDKPIRTSCTGCQHDKNFHGEICYDCVLYRNYTPKDKPRTMITAKCHGGYDKCKHTKPHEYERSCNSHKCIPVKGATDGKLCTTCKHYETDNARCLGCQGDKWQAKEDEGEIEELKAGSSVEEREDKINELVREVNEMKRKVNGKEGV